MLFVVGVIGYGKRIDMLLMTCVELRTIPLLDRACVQAVTLFLSRLGQIVILKRGLI